MAHKVDTEQTCATCKFWQKPEERVDFKNAVNYFYHDSKQYDELYERAQKEDRKFGKCQKIDMGCSLDPSEPVPLAVTMDGSEYKADLFTQAEFGCSLYSKREVSNGA